MAHAFSTLCIEEVRPGPSGNSWAQVNAADGSLAAQCVAMRLKKWSRRFPDGSAWANAAAAAGSSCDHAALRLFSTASRAFPPGREVAQLMAAFKSA